MPQEDDESRIQSRVLRSGPADTPPVGGALFFSTTVEPYVLLSIGRAGVAREMA